MLGQRIALVCILLGMGHLVYGVQKQAELHINAGKAQYMDSIHIPALSYNSSSTFSQKSMVVFLEIDDTITFQVTNNTIKEHGIQFHSSSKDVLVKPGATSSITLNFKKPGVFEGVDHSSVEAQYMGLKMLVIVSPSKAEYVKTFVWCLRDFERDLCKKVDAGGAFKLAKYKPDYFAINGLIYPENMDDTLSTITGKVGDKIRIVMYGAGMAAHSIHFHGYHVKVLSSNKHSKKVGLIKDTVPVKRGEIIELELVPHQPGQYPVHNHNLAAVMSGGMYPNGQFSIMTIGN